MEMSSKLKAMKFMKRKDEAEERKQIEKETQKSVERTHWTLEEEKLLNSSESDSSKNKLKFIIEYDNTGGINGNDSVVRQSFKNFNSKLETEIETDNITKSSSKLSGPVNKMPKLK